MWHGSLRDLKNAFDGHPSQPSLLAHIHFFCHPATCEMKFYQELWVTILDPDVDKQISHLYAPQFLSLQTHSSSVAACLQESHFSPNIHAVHTPPVVGERRVPLPITCFHSQPFLHPIPPSLHHLSNGRHTFYQRYYNHPLPRIQSAKQQWNNGTATQQRPENYTRKYLKYHNFRCLNSTTKIQIWILKTAYFLQNQQFNWNTRQRLEKSNCENVYKT